MNSKNRKSKKGWVLGLLFLCILLVIGILVYGSRKNVSQQTVQPPQESPSQEAADVSSEHEDANPESLLPELFREKILVPALSYHPGTAGSSLSAANASAMILSFITDKHLHLEEQDRVNQLMTDAAALLIEDERNQLKETLPGLCSLVDETLAIYPENRGLYEDAGSEDMADTALAVPGASEDWARMKTALETVFLPE